MSDLMKKAHLPAKLQKKALSAIFYSMMTFNKEAQAALLKLVKEKGWEYVAKKIVKKETQLAKAGVKLKPGEDILGKATRDVLAEEVPAYKIAYAEAPLVPLVENGMIMTGTHAVFALIGQYIAADQKEQLEIEEDIVALMEEMEEPMEFQVQWESEAEIRGRVLKAVEAGME